MDLAPPSFNDLQQAEEWCQRLYRMLEYFGGFHSEYLELKETDELSAPDDSRGRFQLVDAGSGLSQFIVVFPSGTPIVIAKENTDLYNLYEDSEAVAAVSANWPYLLEADASGNLTLTGNLTCVNATLSGELVTPVTSTDTVADPPTETELDALWSSPEDGFQALLWDETASKMYIVTYDGTNEDWWYVLLTKAA